MSTFGQVVTALKARAAVQITLMPVRWDRDQPPQLPDVPSPFVFFRLEMDRARFIEAGGGRGSNRQRTDGELWGLVFMPREAGLEAEATYGEHVAAAFRSYRDAYVSCGPVTPAPAVPGSDLMPPGMDSEVGNYSCIVAAVPLYFDQTG